MDNLDDSEINAKISDSAYSNSCSNSQSRRSHSSKSTRSGSSGSSGYGGKPSTSGSSNKLEQSSKKDKEAKKIKLSHAELPAVLECRPPEPVTYCDVPKEEKHNANVAKTPPLQKQEKAVENIMNTSTTELTAHSHEIQTAVLQTATASLDKNCEIANGDSSGFTCAVSMHDGVVMYATSHLNSNLGFPKDMWIGRSFIDFIHPKDRTTFASQITNGLAVPTIVMGTLKSAHAAGITKCTMVCRIRQYRALNGGFGIVNNVVSYLPFLLKFSFKDVLDDKCKIVYLIIQATPIYSKYRIPKEKVFNGTPFVIKHSAAGLLEYIDVESVPYLGFLPQDIHNCDALLLYHPDDLPYLKSIYEAIVKEGSVNKSVPYRMLTNNGDYVKLESEWSSFVNPWSMKLEFVIAKHHVIEGPTEPDVFQPPESYIQDSLPRGNTIGMRMPHDDKEHYLKKLRDVLAKPAEKARQQVNKRCHDITQIMESLLAEPRPEDELKIDIPEPESTSYERDSVMLGGISPHHDSDSKSSSGTPLSYNQLNYNVNLQRYFDSHQNMNFEEKLPVILDDNLLKPFPSTYLPAVHPTDVNGVPYGSLSKISGTVMSPPISMMPGQSWRLTVSLLNKHNNDMEKELAKSHRNFKGDRSSELRQKKKEHLERCNAMYQPTKAGAAFETQFKHHGVKRARSSVDEKFNKQQCTSSRKVQRQRVSTDSNRVYPTTGAAAGWCHYPSCIKHGHMRYNNYGMPIYRPPPTHIMPGPWMHPPPVYESPYTFSEPPRSSFDMTPPMAHRQSANCLNLPTSNYKQTTEPYTGHNSKPGKFTPFVISNPSSQSGLNSDETMDKTDGESSYSSFYSSFLRTDSGSGTDNSSKRENIESIKSPPTPDSWLTRSPKIPPQKKICPQWMNPGNPDVLFKYQMKPKTKNNVLESDLEKIKQLNQPALVNEQLGQLYSEMLVEGVAARLTLEEGITSSSSSGEDNCFNFRKPKLIRRKRDYNRLSMIYEENAPLPSPKKEEATESESLKS